MGLYEEYKQAYEDTKNSWTSSGTGSPLVFESGFSPTVITPDPYPYATSGTTLRSSDLISKTQYDLLLLQVSELRRRLEEVEERELVLIKKLMESLDGADDKTST